MKLPGNWEDFLKLNTNKTELFYFLAECIKDMHTGDKVILSTKDTQVITSNSNIDLHKLEPCTQEEADTRIFLHVKDATVSGHRNIMIRTVDTDVLVIAISMFMDLTDIDSLWIAFGIGKHFRYIAAHVIVARLGTEKASALLIFHAVHRMRPGIFLWWPW